MNLQVRLIDEKELNKCLKIWIPISIQVFYFLRNILDPEYPCKIFFFKIISFERIYIGTCIYNQMVFIDFIFIPTIKKCSLSPLLGIFLENKIYKIESGKKISQIIPKIWNWKFLFEIPFFSHLKSSNITKQLNDKERIASAFENFGIRTTIKNCLEKE